MTADYKLESQVKDYERLHEILNILLSTMDVDTILYRIVKETIELCRADQCTIYLIESDRLPTMKTLIADEKEQGKILDKHLNRVLAGWVLKHGKSLLTERIEDVLGVGMKEKYELIESVISVPLIVNEKIIGVINMISEKKESVFGQREEHLMQILARQFGQYIQNARLHSKLFSETERLKEQIREKNSFKGILGKSAKMQNLFTLLESVIPTEVRVLIEGESGTGKEKIARAVHFNGPRANKPFIAVDCGALPANLLESELFGYLKGAFTGATQDKKGLFAEAQGGTLFLDEISNMPLEIQAKFLRALQEEEIRPLGGRQTQKIDVRIIAATNENMKEQVKSGQFRQDLYFRLNVVNIGLPPLRERTDDIGFLADYFFQQMNDKYEKSINGIEPEVRTLLESYAWPGNVREMENAIERAVILCKTSRLTKNDFTFLEISEEQILPFKPQTWEDAVFEIKRNYLLKILEYTGGQKKRAAEILGIPPSYLSRLIKNLKAEN